MRSKDLFAMIAAGAMLGFGAGLSGCDMEDNTLDDGVDDVRDGVNDTTDDIDEGLEDTQDDLDDATTPDTTNPNAPPAEEPSTTTP